MLQMTAIGNLGRDAEYHSGKTDRISFSVATTSGYGDNKATTWVRCTLWGKRASEKFADALTKGTKVVAIGSGKMHEYEGKQYLELNVSEIEFAGSRKESSGSPPASQSKAPPPPSDDIPF